MSADSRRFRLSRGGVAWKIARLTRLIPSSQLTHTNRALRSAISRHAEPFAASTGIVHAGDNRHRRERPGGWAVMAAIPCPSERSPPMAATQEHAVKVLNSLIETTLDSANGYQ